MAKKPGTTRRRYVCRWCLVGHPPAALSHRRKLKAVSIILILCLAAGPVSAQQTLTGGSDMAVDAATDGRLAFDLQESIWILPKDGVQADRITAIDTPARRPRWSPLDDAILYQARVDGLDQIRLYQFASGLIRNIGDDQHLNQHPSWHPLGERILFSSDRSQSGFDIWEFDLATGLSWRITHRDGDELEPAWSPNGRDLLYVHFFEHQYTIMLRRFGQPDRALITSSDRLSAPRWRPDGSLITFLRDEGDNAVIEMIILSDPLLVRPLITGEDFVSAPLTWLDRQELLYTVDGAIRRRNFNSWTSRNVPFRATLQPVAEVAPIEQPRRELSEFDLPTGRLIVRSSRLFDGIGGGYQSDIDIVIENGRIVALEPRQDRPGEVLVDLGNVTALPGFIDSFAALPDNFDDSLGALMLSLGITTIVAEHAAAAALDEHWSGKDTPGPRILDAGDAATVAALRRGTDSFADANTPGISMLLRARQAAWLPVANPTRRFAELPDLQSRATSIVVGSEPNALPPGLALHGEFLALSAAGLNGEQVLRGAGVNAAAYLKLGVELGRIAPGARADLVLVDGDPLHNSADLRKVVGVVRNGRFFSAIGLIERASAVTGVE